MRALAHIDHQMTHLVVECDENVVEEEGERGNYRQEESSTWMLFIDMKKRTSTVANCFGSDQVLLQCGVGESRIWVVLDWMSR